MDKKQRSELAKALGSAGGKKTKKLYGKEHYQKLAEHMNKVRAEKKKAKDGTQAVKKKEVKKTNSLNMEYEP